MNNILIIDDEPGIRSVLSEILEEEGYNLFSAEDGHSGLAMIKGEPIDLVLLDIWLPNMGGIDVLNVIKDEFPAIEVIMISGHANVDLAVKAIKMGAFDFLEKPLDLERVITLSRNALHLEKLKKENQSLKSALMTDEMVGECQAMKEIKNRIDQSAKSDARIMILGDNGTGKELVARSIHLKSLRNFKPFIEVNCAAIPDTLIESELFGHEKGAFTSAVGRRTGKFELADGGTLFLDEVADMSLSAQSKVLRAVQEMKFERVGGEESVQVDVRIISATNKNIQQEVKEGRFREDLFFRLNVIPLMIPSLNERKDDIPLLTEYFSAKLQEDIAEDKRKRFSSAALKKMLDYSWPGNIRELKNFIERTLVMSENNVINGVDVDAFLTCEETEEQIKENKNYHHLKLNEAKDTFECDFLIRKLEENGYNVSRTAQVLGIYPSNLHSKIKKYGIKILK